MTTGFDQSRWLGLGSLHTLFAREHNLLACARDICTYIYEAHGRFPADRGTIHVPGVWLQAHHVDLDYYEKFFRNGPAGRGSGAVARRGARPAGTPGRGAARSPRA